MAVSILHIGLPLDDPSIPAEDAPRIHSRLAALQERMRALGYGYEVMHASPRVGLALFRERLRTRPPDAVLIGGGVVGNEDLRFFLEQIVNTTHELAPRAKVLFFSHTVDVQTTVGRWFAPQSPA